MLGFLKRGTTLVARATATRATSTALTSSVDQTANLFSQLSLSTPPTFSPLLTSTQTRRFSSNVDTAPKISYERFENEHFTPTIQAVRERLNFLVKKNGLPEGLTFDVYRQKDAFEKITSFHYILNFSDKDKDGKPRNISEVHFLIDLEKRRSRIILLDSFFGNQNKKIGGKPLEHFLLEAAVYTSLLHHCSSFALPPLSKFQFSTEMGFEKARNGFKLDVNNDDGSIGLFLDQVNSSWSEEMRNKILDVIKLHLKYPLRTEGDIEDFVRDRSTPCPRIKP